MNQQGRSCTLKNRMYEYSLTHTINEALQDLCVKLGWKKINRLTVKIGGMRPVNPELMAFIFSAETKNTPVEGADFSVMLIPITYYCRNCKRRSMREDTKLLCPYCGSKNVQLLSGLEFTVEVLEFESN